MKKSTRVSIGFMVVGGWLANGTAWAAQPIVPPQSGPQTGGIPRCEAELAQCQADLAEAQAFPATGQTTCWYFDEGQEWYVADPDCTNPASAGQDGDIKAGAELSYTETTYTVIDNNTQLEWMKQDDNGGDCASSPGYLDKDCGFTWDEAFTFVASLNTDPCFADHCDWRVPNVKELQSIVNYQNIGPAVSAEFNTGCVATCTVDDPVNACSCTSTGYWSSTSSTGVPSFGAWSVGFFHGSVGGDNREFFRRVRAVRGGL